MSNDKLDNLIRDTLKETDNNFSKVARLLGVDYFALQARFDNTPTQEFPSAIGAEPDDIKTLGKPGMERYVIAVKKRGYQWPTKYDYAIGVARRQFDAGTHEMVQSVTASGWVVQYLIPRLVHTQPRRFFSELF